MLTELPGTGIQVGGLADHAGINDVIWACKTKHLQNCNVGWTRKTLERDDIDYLCRVDMHRRSLSINWVDGPAHLFDWSAKVWPLAFGLLDDWRSAGRMATILCDQGLSRSPTLAMTYLAKRTDHLPDDFHLAVVGFVGMYPAWTPKFDGICGWVSDHWEELA